MIEARTSRVRLPMDTGCGERERGFRRGAAGWPERPWHRAAGEDPADCRPAGDGALS